MKMKMKMKMKIKNNTVLDKTKGCLIGLACGDYLGMPVEFFSRDKVLAFFGKKQLSPYWCYHRSRVLPPGYYTDDTSMAICLAESLVESGFDVQDQFNKYKKWFLEGYGSPDDRAFGIGQHTLRILTSQTVDSIPTKLENDIKAGGNGALMRSAPIGLFYYQQSYREIREKSIASAIVTHNNVIVAWCCTVLNTFISFSLQGIDKKRFVERFIDYSPLCPKEVKDVITQYFPSLDESSISNTGYALDTLNIALYSFFSSDNYEECITKAIFLGGDTDTQGAVTGALAGAYYGMGNIPKQWVITLLRKDYIESLGETLYKESTSILERGIS